MKKEDISLLLQRYLSAREMGKELYFDADEIDELLGSFEESDDYTYYGEVLALGQKLHPGNTDLQIRQCKFYAYNDDYESALALIDIIAETDNQDLDLIRLECYCMMEQYGKLIEYIEKLINSECNYLETAFEYIAPLLSDMEMTKEAHDFINRGLRLFPRNVMLKNELCYIKELEGDIDGAIDLCNDLIDKNPYSHEQWFSLGRLYSMKAEYEKAIEAFDFALTCDDSDPDLKMLKAYCLYMNENYEKALEVYQEIESDSAIAERIKPLMAECYIKLENYDKGYKILKEIITKRPATCEAATYINYVRCCTETERDEEGHKILIKAAGIFPTDVRLLSLLALTYVQKGEDLLALETTEQLFDILEKEDSKRPEDYDSLFRVGQYFYVKGDFDKALKYYNKVYAVNPDLPFIHMHMAMAYLSQGDMDHFVEHFRQISGHDMMKYLESQGVNIKEIEEKLYGKHIPPEDLTKEFLNNKDNSN